MWDKLLVDVRLEWTLGIGHTSTHWQLHPSSWLVSNNPRLGFWMLDCGHQCALLKIFHAPQTKPSWPCLGWGTSGKMGWRNVNTCWSRMIQYQDWICLRSWDVVRSSYHWVNWKNSIRLVFVYVIHLKWVNAS